MSTRSNIPQDKKAHPFGITELGLLCSISGRLLLLLLLLLLLQLLLYCSCY